MCEPCNVSVNCAPLAIELLSDVSVDCHFWHTASEQPSHVAAPLVNFALTAFAIRHALAGADVRFIGSRFVCVLLSSDCLRVTRSPDACMSTINQSLFYKSQQNSHIKQSGVLILACFGLFRVPSIMTSKSSFSSMFTMLWSLSPLRMCAVAFVSMLLP